MRTLSLFLIYALVVTPAGLLGRLVRDPLARRPDAAAATYWITSERHRRTTRNATPDRRHR